MEEVTITMNNPQENGIEKQLQNAELSTNNPQSDVWAGDSCSIIECEHYLQWLKDHGIEKKNAPVPGAGRKCIFCENKEKWLKLLQDYIEKHEDLGGKATIPFIQEYAIIIKQGENRIQDWKNKKTAKGEVEHPELVELLDRLMNVQKLRLLQRTLARYNPTGAIFQLKANHGLIETEKKVIAGDTKEPLLIEIIGERKEVLENAE